MLNRVLGAGGILFLIVLAVLVGRAATPTRVQAQTGLPGVCSAGTIYNVAGLPTGGSSVNNGNIYSLNVTSGANTLVGRFGTSATTSVGNASADAVNGLAVNTDVTQAYGVQQTAAAAGQNIYTFISPTDRFAVLGPSTTASLIMGAFDPQNHIYYYGGYLGSTTATGQTDNPRRIVVYGYNTDTRTPLGQLLTVQPVPFNFSTGDFTFDGLGNLWIVAGTFLTGTTQTNSSNIYSIPAPLPTTSAGATTVAPTFHATNTAPGGTGFYNGIAFAADGTIYAQYATTGNATLADLNPNNGEVVSRTEQTGEPSSGILTDLAGCSRPGTLTVQKDLTRAAPGDQFRMSVTVGTTPATEPVTTTGTANGLQAERAVVTGRPSTTYSVSEQLISNTTNPSAYDSSWECHDTVSPTNFTSISGSGTSFDVSFPSPASATEGANILCTFTNVPVAPSLTLMKALGGTGRISPGDQFTMQIRTGSATGPVVTGTGSPTTTGSGTGVTPGTGTTTVTPATAGPYFLTEVMASGSTSALTQYEQITQCEDLNGVQTTGLTPPQVAPGAFGPITPVAGSDVECTMTNSPAQTLLGLNKLLGTARVRNTDQFTVSIHTGTAGGPLLGSASTTAGSGSAVTPGTGNTGLQAATAGTTYFLTETPAGTTNPALYNGTITCVDPTGHQTNLPNGAPFTSPLEITPVTGAEISCTITNRAVSPTLQLTKAVTARVNSGDQFTAQILGPDERTPVAESTTTGTETSTTTPVFTADHTQTYFLNEVPAGTTNALQYSQTISCADANGVVATLPSGPFEGPLPIMPPLGSAIQCTITNTPVPPSILLNKELSGDRLVDTDQFTVQILQNGTVVGNTTNATTTGSGSTVTTGTGTTFLSPAAAGTTYTLTEVAAGSTDLANYSSSILCDDTQGLQTTGLPQNVSTPATVTPIAGASIECTITNTPRPAPAITVTKSAEPKTYAAAGETIVYTFVVTNSGNVPLTGITVVDDKLGTINCPSTTLAVAESMTCTANHVTTAADVIAGDIHNTVTATGTGPSGSKVTGDADETVTLTHQPGITVTKSASPTTFGGAGETITYTFLVTNSGNVPLTGITLTDDRLGTIPCPATTLAVGASMTCTATHITTAADVAAGGIHNTVTATGTAPDGSKVTDSAQETVTLKAVPPPVITTPAPPPPAVPGLPKTGAVWTGSGPSGSGPMTLALLLAGFLALIGMVGASIAWLHPWRFRRRPGA